MREGDVESRKDREEEVSQGGGAERKLFLKEIVSRGRGVEEGCQQDKPKCCGR